jgi:hypothetical protein
MSVRPSRSKAGTEKYVPNYESDPMRIEEYLFRLLVAAYPRTPKALEGTCRM